MIALFEVRICPDGEFCGERCPQLERRMLGQVCLIGQLPLRVRENRNLRSELCLKSKEKAPGPKPRCSTCKHGPCVQCKHLRECRPDNCKWEAK